LFCNGADLRALTLDVVEGHSQYLAGKLQERYGITKEKAEEEIAEFHRKL